MNLAQIPINELVNYCAKLTIEQADSLRGRVFLQDSYFNPIQDIEDNWIISAQEVAYCANPEFLWIKDLPMIPFVPKPARPLFGGEA
jgi:hypothetical protein